ncbi:MAG: DUF664 domain-containing protein [Acidimicrobiales bacterium]|nr:DUF664 domain-containing protein [Acidimicrobiales bacterium]
MYPPAVHDEITGILNYLEEQLAALRAATFGLTDAQVRERPCRSTLSVGGLVKHATQVMRGGVARLRNPDAPRSFDEEAFAA